jgi:hypothetical protein
VSDKTIDQIQQEYGSAGVRTAGARTAGAQTLTRYHDTLDAIKEDRELERVLEQHKGGGYGYGA